MDFTSEHLTHYFNTDHASADHKRPKINTANCLLFISKGHGYLQIRRRVYPITAGQCCLIPCDCAASYWAESGEEWDYIWLLFEGELFDEILRKIAFSPETPICDTTEEQAELFHKIGARKYNSCNGEYYYTLGLVVQLLSSFIVSFPSETLITEDGSMRAILSFIHSNLCRRELTVEYLARIMGVSRIALYQRFKKELDCSPSEYIQRRRIRQAQYLLSTTKLPVTQIAAAVGYDNPLYFSRAFHKITSLSPTAYRAHFHRHEVK